MAEREALAEKRITSILRKYTIASARTLEQKISDAGPNNQRIDPHILTPVRNKMLTDSKLVKVVKQDVPWFHLPDTDQRHIKQKHQHLLNIQKRSRKRDVTLRVGQALEIAIFRSLSDQKNKLIYFGRFKDIDTLDDSNLYKKEEPPTQFSNNFIPGGKCLDFLVIKDNILGGIEAKNTREWLYPDRPEIKDLLYKCYELDAVPILIARRIPFVTFKLLNACGCIVHQTYRQHYPSSEKELAEDLKDKTLFGFHDIILGNQPDARLNKFIHKNLPEQLSLMRPRYEEFNDLTAMYGNGEIEYKVFAARVRRREQGINEDRDTER